MENQKSSFKSVVYMGNDHSVLKLGEKYEVRSEDETNIQLVSPTGFCGVPKKDIKFV